MNVREIDVSEISAAVERLAAEANCFLPADVSSPLFAGIFLAIF